VEKRKEEGSLRDTKRSLKEAETLTHAPATLSILVSVHRRKIHW